jgi:tetratricopeptide (TPR) repeat protein
MTLAQITPRTAESVDLAAAFYEMAKDFSEANYAKSEPLLRRALAIFEASYTPNHPQLRNHIWTIFDLASLLDKTDRPKEAEPLYRSMPALATEDAASAPDAVKVGTTLSYWAEMLYSRGRLAEAVPLKLRALELYEKHLDPDHWKTRIARTRFQRMLYEAGYLPMGLRPRRPPSA